MGDGGVGKSIIAQTALTACAAGVRELYGAPMASGVALGIFAEEEQDELERRERPICESLGVELARLDNLHVASNLGAENLLVTYQGGVAVPTEFYYRIDATCAALRPHLLVLDPAADFYGGNPISQSEVRQFIQVILGGLCARHGLTLLLPMHPSAAGMASGEGAGFSVAWSNSVRSRLYLHRRSDDDPSRVTLARKKSNYAARGEELDLLFEQGAFAREGGIVQAIRETNARRAILRLLAECEAIGRRVASSPKANENVSVILGERDGFPTEFRGNGRSHLFRLLRQLEETGLITEATVTTPSRNKMGVWQLTDLARKELQS